MAHRETFGGDELANVNRYNLWPDPQLNPRTVRTSVDDQAKVELFCPVPQMVGGGTVHRQGWLPRFTPEDFWLRSIAGDVPGTTLADWPISYDELEPYYDKIEWAFGVSGQAGANAYEGGAAAVPVPADATVAVRGEVPQGCAELGWNSFPTPQAALSQPFDGRPPTVVSAFAQQHGDPTGTRSSALNVFIPHALATGGTTSGRRATSGNSRSTRPAGSGPRCTPTPTGGRSSKRLTRSSWPAGPSSPLGCC